MKRIFLAIAMMVGVSTIAVCQNVNVNIENGSNYTDGYKYINGVCSCEDIGGVEVQGNYVKNMKNSEGGYSEYTYVRFQNYNNFRVTVLYDFEYGDEHKTGTLVIDADNSKELFIEFTYGVYRKFKLNCLIVRKMAQ